VRFRRLLALIHVLILGGPFEPRFRFRSSRIY